jgi:hypothetical protein
MKAMLQNWVEQGWLIPHRPVKQEIEKLVSVAGRDLVECELPGLSDDWRFNIAYSSIINTGAAALAVQGFRAARDSHHYWIIQSLRYTLGIDKDIVDQLDSYRKTRNTMTYEEMGIASKREVEEIIVLARQLHETLLDTLNKSKG